MDRRLNEGKTMEIHEAKSLRWLVNQFPLTIPAKEDTDKICNAIHLYAKAGADKLEAQAKRIEELDKEVAKLTNHIQENAKPLTIEELREMCGEPVFIRKLDGDQSFWMLAYPDAVSNRLGWLDYRNYGSAWVAYRHKPKEVQQ